VKTVDLSHALFQGAPSYPTDPDIIVQQQKDINKDNSYLHSIHFGTHSGTHLDVPAHIIDGGKTLTDYPLNYFFGTGIVIDNDSYLHLNNFANKFEAVLFNTGWYKKFNDPKIFFGKDRPAIPRKLIEFVVRNKIKIFGCDLPSVDASGLKEKPFHRLLLENEVIIYESLNNLDQLLQLTPFWFCGFPLPFKDLDGSPVRAVAILDKS